MASPSAPHAQTTGRRAGLVWRALLVALVLVGFALTSTDAFTSLFFGCYAAIGALLVDRRPRNVIGWLTLAIAFGFVGVTSRPAGLYDLATLRDGSAPLGQFLWAWVQGWAVYATFSGFVALMVLFPEGRLPSGRARGLAGALIATAVVVTILVATGPAVSFSPDGGTPTEIPNRIGVLGWLPIWSIVGVAAFVPLFLAILLAGVASIFIRFRRSTGVLRLQLRWLVAALTFLVAAVAFGVSADSIAPASLAGVGWLPAVVAYPMVPAAIAVAVLRYRLYDIDTIINRTIVYGSLTAILAGVSSVVITVGKDLFVGLLGPGSDFSIVLSTLIVVTAFEPVKKRIQTLVDQRFKETHDPAQTLDAFVAETRALIAAPDVERTLRRFLDVCVEAYRGHRGEITWEAIDLAGSAQAGETGSVGAPEMDPGTTFVGEARSSWLSVRVEIVGAAIPVSEATLRAALDAVLTQLRPLD